MPVHPAPRSGAETWGDATVSMEHANRIGVTVVLPAVVLLSGTAWLLLHGPPRFGWWGAAIESLHLLVGGVLAGAAAMLLSVVVHEALHALGIRLFARRSWRSIHYGIDRETVSPYVGCTEPMTARAYRGWAALPGALLGVCPLVWGLAAGNGWLVLFGAYNLVAAAGDLVVLWAIRHVPGGACVQDHPFRAGCRVLAPSDAPAAGAP